MLDRTLVIWMGEFGRHPSHQPERGPRPLSSLLQRRIGGGWGSGRAGDRGVVRRRDRGGGSAGRGQRPAHIVLPSPQDRPQEGEHEPRRSSDQDRRRRHPGRRVVRLRNRRIGRTPRARNGDARPGHWWCGAGVHNSEAIRNRLILPEGTLLGWPGQSLRAPVWILGCRPGHEDIAPATQSARFHMNCRFRIASQWPSENRI